MKQSEGEWSHEVPRREVSRLSAMMAAAVAAAADAALKLASAREAFQLFQSLKQSSPPRLWRERRDATMQIEKEWSREKLRWPIEMAAVAAEAVSS